MWRHEIGHHDPFNPRHFLPKPCGHPRQSGALWQGGTTVDNICASASANRNQPFSPQPKACGSPGAPQKVCSSNRQSSDNRRVLTNRSQPPVDDCNRQSTPPSLAPLHNHGPGPKNDGTSVSFCLDNNVLLKRCEAQNRPQQTANSVIATKYGNSKAQRCYTHNPHDHQTPPFPTTITSK